MAFYILPKRSNVAGKIPGQEGSANTFSKVGEIAVNINDSVFFVKASDSDFDSDRGIFEKAVRIISRTYNGVDGVVVDNSGGSIRSEEDQTKFTVTITDTTFANFNDIELVPRSYVDQTLEGTTVYAPVENFYDSDLSDFDTNTLTALGLNDSDRVLINSSTNQTLNGVYVVDTSVSPLPLLRADEFTNGSTLPAGSFFFIRRGSRAGQGFILRNEITGDLTENVNGSPLNDPLSTTNIIFDQFSGTNATGFQINGQTTGTLNFVERRDYLNLTFTGTQANVAFVDSETISRDSDWFTGASLLGARQDPVIDSDTGPVSLDRSISSRGGRITNQSSIAIGHNSQARGLETMILGTGTADGQGSMGLGRFVTSERGQISIGTLGRNSGRNTTRGRQIIFGNPTTFVAGESAHQFVTVPTTGSGQDNEDKINRPDMLITKGWFDSEIDAIDDLTTRSNGQQISTTATLVIKGSDSQDFLSTSGVQLGQYADNAETHIDSEGPFVIQHQIDENGNYVQLFDLVDGNAGGNKNVFIRCSGANAVKTGHAYYLRVRNRSNTSNAQTQTTRAAGANAAVVALYPSLVDAVNNEDGIRVGSTVRAGYESISGNVARVANTSRITVKTTSTAGRDALNEIRATDPYDSDFSLGNILVIDGNRYLITGIRDTASTLLVLGIADLDGGGPPGTTDQIFVQSNPGREQINFLAQLDEDTNVGTDLRTLDPNNRNSVNTYGPASVQDANPLNVNTFPIDGSIITDQTAVTNIMYNIYVWDAATGDISIHRA